LLVTSAKNTSRPSSTQSGEMRTALLTRDMFGTAGTTSYSGPHTQLIRKYTSALCLAETRKIELRSTEKY
jgi:hypothetical protein